MTATYTYDGDALLTVRRNSASFQEVADYGRVGSGSMVLNDAAGTLAIVGHKEFIAEESACSFARTLTGYIGERNIRRNTERTGGGRELETSILDLNARLAFYVIRGKAWKRPVETIEDRLTALLASAFLSPLVVDNGLVEYPTNELDANDYRGQFPTDVLRDMALVVGFNFFVYPDDGTYEPSLWFKDSNVSVAFTSDLRLSNDLADLDYSTTFPVSFETTSLKRDPSQVFSGVFMPYQKGSVFRARAATSLAFEPRHGVAPNAQVKSRAKAIELADKFLFTRRNEEDTVTTRVQLPRDKVNLIRAGQRIEAKFTDFGPEGYGDFTWFRVVERTVHPLLKAVPKYDVDLILSPQEATCAVIVQQSDLFSTLAGSFDNPVQPGNVIAAIGFFGDTSSTPPIEEGGVDAGFTMLGDPLESTGNDGGSEGHVWVQAKVADSSNQDFGFSINERFLWMLVEIGGGATVTGATVLSQAQGASNGNAATLDIGDFTSASGVALMIQAVGKSIGHASMSGVGNHATFPAGWTERYDGRSDPNDIGSLPFVAIGDATPRGTTIDASIAWAGGAPGADIGTWAGIAVLFSC